MRTTLYLIRHAQSHPSVKLHHSQWPLSAKGKSQAENLAVLLMPLKIKKIYSSPYLRCLQTFEPFSKRSGLRLQVEENLHERLAVIGIVDNFPEIWRKSWEDFDFALKGCESSRMALARFSAAVLNISNQNPGSTIAVSTHGNVISLFLNSIDSAFGIEKADKMTNPDIFKIIYEEGRPNWDRVFELPEIDSIATGHMETPIDWG